MIINNCAACGKSHKVEIVKSFTDSFYRCSGKIVLIENKETKELLERIRNDFMYHPPVSKEQESLYDETRARFYMLAKWLVETRPESRELSLALTELEYSMFMANAAIARNDIR